MHSNLSSRLKMLRRNKNITQKQVADILDIPRGTYAHYELGKRSPDHSMLVKIAEYFEVSTDYLLGRTDDLNANNTVVDSAYSILEKLEKALEQVMLADDTKEIIKMLIKNDPFVKPDRDGSGK